jgi:hypothetical protein
MIFSFAAKYSGSPGYEPQQMARHTAMLDPRFNELQTQFFDGLHPDFHGR